MGKARTINICLSDIPKDQIINHPNGKKYMNITTYDFDQPDSRDNDFSVSMCLTEAQRQAKKEGKQITRVFIGHGRIWPDKK